MRTIHCRQEKESVPFIEESSKPSFKMPLQFVHERNRNAAAFE
jgi:hypothetical protein